MNISTIIPMKTLVNGIKTVELKTRVPEELFDEYLARIKAVKVTEAAMHAVIIKGEEYAQLGRNIHVSFDVLNTIHNVTFKYQLYIEGNYTKKHQHTGSCIDYRTMNLLLNSKIIDDKEKRQLLKQNGLLPEFGKDNT